MKDAEVQALAAQLAYRTARLNIRQLSIVFGYRGTFTLRMMKLAASVFGDSPFRGRTATVADVQAWFRRHPEFVPTHVWLSRKELRQRAVDHLPPAAGKSDAPSPKHGRQTPSPERSAPRPAPSA